MNLATMFAVFMMKGTAVDPGDPPTGPPTNVVSSHYGSPTKVRLSWTNGDATAYTRIYMEQGTCPGTPPFYIAQNPGVTSVNTAFLHSNDPHRYQLSHYKNGQESDKTDCAQHGGAQ